MKKKLAALLCAITMLLTACGGEVQPYTFPLLEQDLQMELTKQKLDVEIAQHDENPMDEHSILVVKDDLGVTYGFATTAKDGYRFLHMAWTIPPQFTDEEVVNFYNSQLKKYLGLTNALYGSGAKTKKSFDNYLKDNEVTEEHLSTGDFWTDRQADTHISIHRRIYGSENRIRLGYVTMMNGDAYEHLLKSTSDAWVKRSELESFEIQNCTVSELTAVVTDESTAKYIRATGHLEDIKEAETPPVLPKILYSSTLDLNAKEFLSAKLVDDTGSVDVFVQKTSMIDSELNMERQHDILLYLDQGKPVYVVHLSALK